MSLKIPRILCNPGVPYEHAWLAFERCRAGAIIECGVYEGFLSIFLRFGLRKYNCHFRQYAADTFEGFPLESIDQTKYKAGDLAPIHKNFLVSELEKAGIIVLKGDVRDTLQKIPKEEKFFFVFLDMDCFQPTLTAWRYLHEKILPGGRIGFHDYGAPNFPKITKFCDEVRGLPDWKEVFHDGKIERGDRTNRFMFLEKQ